MICKNCGAEISEDELLCPYCGTENLKVAQKEQQNYIEGYEKRKRALKKVPEKVVKKTTKGFFYVAGGIFGTVILLLIVSVAFSKITRADMLSKQEKELEKLEKYYVSGEYASMTAYLDKIDKRGGSYEKYRRVAELYENMDWYIENLKSNAEFAKKIDLDAVNVEIYLEWCFEELAEIREMEELEFPYEEKAGVLYIKEQYYKALKEYALLTEEEIDSAVKSTDLNSSDNDYMELAEISIQRMEEQFR